jgi:dolichol-phosphate mannosyltransferase
MSDDPGGTKLPVAVVIPCYRVRRHLGSVISALRGRVDHIYAVDDCCPESSGHYIAETFSERSVTVLFHAANQGVGGAMVTGYRQALRDGHQIVVKLDGDGQMDPRYLPALVAPILRGDADYTKGNRFFDLRLLRNMPNLRLFGNSCLSFVNKLSSGYWDIMDPTNGFTAIGRAALERLDLDLIEPRYFFESDMLFRLSLIRAVVRDVPMRAIYGDEKSSLRIRRVAVEFPCKYMVRAVKRFGYLYLLRDFNMGSLHTLFGAPLILFGLAFGIRHWVESVRSGIPATTGTVMLAVLPIMLGTQLLLSAIGYDIGNRPTEPLQKLFPIDKE